MPDPTRYGITDSGFALFQEPPDPMRRLAMSFCAVPDYCGDTPCEECTTDAKAAAARLLAAIENQDGLH